MSRCANVLSYLIPFTDLLDERRTGERGGWERRGGRGGGRRRTRSQDREKTRQQLQYGHSHVTHVQQTLTNAWSWFTTWSRLRSVGENNWWRVSWKPNIFVQITMKEVFDKDRQAKRGSIVKLAGHCHSDWHFWFVKKKRQMIYSLKRNQQQQQTAYECR